MGISRQFLAENLLCPDMKGVCETSEVCGTSDVCECVCVCVCVCV